MAKSFMQMAEEAMAQVQGISADERPATPAARLKRLAGGCSRRRRHSIHRLGQLAQ